MQCLLEHLVYTVSTFIFKSRDFHKMASIIPTVRELWKSLDLNMKVLAVYTKCSQEDIALKKDISLSTACGDLEIYYVLYNSATLFSSLLYIFTLSS